MSARLLDGKALAAKHKEKLRKEIDHLRRRYHKVPSIASILVGDDPSSMSYTQSQQRTAHDVGIEFHLLKVSPDHLLEAIEGVNRGPYYGVILNKPLPKHNYADLINRILPSKDLEGLSETNLGKLFLGQARALTPCTAAAVLAHLRESGVMLRGKEAVVLGRSETVGKPTALLLLKEDLTVTICHSKTMNLQQHVARADVVVAAVGKKHFVHGDWVKSGAVVIDVGINDDQGKIVGDVDFESCSKKASYITPVPGGVGPLTSIMLMHNSIHSFKLQVSAEQ